MRAVIVGRALRLACPEVPGTTEAVVLQLPFPRSPSARSLAADIGGPLSPHWPGRLEIRRMGVSCFVMLLNPLFRAYSGKT